MKICERFTGKHSGAPLPDLLPTAELAQTTEILLKELQVRLSNTPEFTDVGVTRWQRWVPDEEKPEKCISTRFTKDGFMYLIGTHFYEPSVTMMSVYRTPENEPMSTCTKESIVISSGNNTVGSMTYQRMGPSVANELHRDTGTAEVRIRQFMESLPKPPSISQSRLPAARG